jgi:hypothetical protein
MFKRFALLTATLLIALSFVGASVPARAAEAIKYGDSVKGEITDAAIEVEYVIKGEKDDVVIMTVARDNDQKDNKLVPFLSLSDASSVVVDTTKRGVFNSVTVAQRLPASGEFTLTVGREKGKDGTTVGKYVLTVLKATPIEAGKVYEDKLLKTQNVLTSNSFYTFTGTGKPVTVTFTKVDGKRIPRLLIATISDGAIRDEYILEGKSLTTGTLTLTPDNRVVYLLAVQPGLTNFSSSSEVATYNFKLEAVK